MNIVFINQEQFGYHIDTYYYCKYLKKDHSITYICWDHNLPKISMNGLQIKYIHRDFGPIRVIKLLQKVIRLTSSTNTIIFITQFKFIASLIQLVRYKNPFIFDIRTGSVELSKLKRYLENTLLKLECCLFKNITIISKSLADQLGLSQKTSILPLGADCISHSNKEFKKIDLLYVGTLTNRNIDQAVEGFIKFYKKKGNECSAKFTIIGAGRNNEIETLKEIVKKKNLEHVIHILGRIPHDKLQSYFDEHNIGVSFIPMTDFYDVQPPTKTFEYLLSGMPVIATSTSENKLVINKSNGILFKDTPNDFYNGLIKLEKKLPTYNSILIRKCASKYSWEVITKEFINYLDIIRTSNAVKTYKK